MPVEFDPQSTIWRADPFPKYRELRDHAPVHRAESGMWSISRYDHVMHVLKSSETFSSKAMFTEFAGA